MELIFTHQVGFDQLKNEQFDFFVAASGYENRCSYLIDSIEINADNKIVIAFDNKKDLLYRKKTTAVSEMKALNLLRNRKVIQVR